MSARQFLLVLLARGRVVLAVFGIVVLATVVVTITSTKLYSAAASVLLDTQISNSNGTTTPGQLPTGYMATQVDVAMSEPVAQQVVRSLHLDTDESFLASWRRSTGGQGDRVAWIANLLHGGLSVTPSRESSVINIAFDWPDAREAARMANAFARAYIDTSIQLKVDQARQYANGFAERAHELHAELQARQRQLADFQRENAVVVSDERFDIETSKLSELSTQLLQVQAQRQDSQSRQRQAATSNETLSEVLQSAVIAGLKSDLSRAETKRQEFSSRLGPNHPEVLANSAEIVGLHAKIAQESARIAASLGNTTEINLRRESDLRSALEAQKARLLQMRDQRDAASVLQGDIATAQRNLDVVTQRLAQSSLESRTQQTNIVQLTSAVAPLRPASPKSIHNLLLGMFLGAVLAAGVALLMEIADRRVRHDRELPQLLGVPLLGSIGNTLDFSPDKFRSLSPRDRLRFLLGFPGATLRSFALKT